MKRKIDNCFLPPTSSENCGILVFGEKVRSTLTVPPLGSKLMSPVGENLSTERSLSIVLDGVKPSLKVMGAGLLFTIGTCFFTV